MGIYNLRKYDTIYGQRYLLSEKISSTIEFGNIGIFEQFVGRKYSNS